MIILISLNIWVSFLLVFYFILLIKQLKENSLIQVQIMNNLIGLIENIQADVESLRNRRWE